MTKQYSPFSFGVTLKSLDVQTTDISWTPTVLTNNALTFNKVRPFFILNVH